MSSLRTVQSSKASIDPSIPASQLHTSENAIVHRPCANRIVPEDEEREKFPNLLQQHANRFRPIETRMIDTQSARPPDGDALDRTVVAFDVAAAPASPLDGAPTVKLPNDPSPISEHSPSNQATDSETLVRRASWPVACRHQTHTPRVRALSPGTNP
jgi:hypothetical protein